MKDLTLLELIGTLPAIAILSCAWIAIFLMSLAWSAYAARYTDIPQWNVGNVVVYCFCLPVTLPFFLILLCCWLPGWIGEIIFKTLRNKKLKETSQ